MRHGFIAWALLALQTPVPDLPKQHLKAKPRATAVVAQVGNVAIKASDLERYLWDWRAREALQDLITHQMIVNEARRLKVTVTNAAVQKELDKQLAEVKAALPPGETLEASIRDRGFPRSRLFLRIKSEQLLNAIVLKSFDRKNYVKVSTILIRPRTEQASDLAEALRRAESAYSALINGEPWSDVLSRHTEDAGALQADGSIGWKEHGAFPPTVRQEMARQKPGAITKPAQTANGIQIFRLDARGESATGTVLEELKAAYLQVVRPGYLEDLKKRTKIVEKLG